MSLLNLTIMIPVFRLNRVQTPQSYIIIDTVLTYFLWVVDGTIFHLIARVFRGKGHYSASIVTYLFLTAFFPVIGLVGLPVTMLTQPMLMNGANSLTRQFYVSLAPKIDSLPMAVSDFLVVALVGWYLVSLARAYRVVHQFGAFRTFVVTVTAVLCVAAFEATVETQIHRILWMAYT